jgi:hypothetical protein
MSTRDVLVDQRCQNRAVPCLQITVTEVATDHLVHRVYVRSPAWPGDAAGDGRTAHVSVTSEIHPNTHPQERAKSTKDGSDTPAKHTKHRSKAFSLPLPLSSKRAKARFGRIEPFHWPCLVLSSRPSRTDLGPTPGLGTKPLETVDPIFLELCCAVCRAESQGC